MLKYLIEEYCICAIINSFKRSIKPLNKYKGYIALSIGVLMLFNSFVLLGLQGVGILKGSPTIALLIVIIFLFSMMIILLSLVYLGDRNNREKLNLKELKNVRIKYEKN